MPKDYVPLREHLEALRAADKEFQVERDRRYTEVITEQRRTIDMRVREERRALKLARAIQDYKDEKANELRAQIESERGNYISRSEFEQLESKIDVLGSTLAEKIQANSNSFNKQHGTLTGEIAELRKDIAVGPEALQSLKAAQDRADGSHTEIVESRAAATLAAQVAALKISIAAILVGGIVIIIGSLITHGFS